MVVVRILKEKEMITLERKDRYTNVTGNAAELAAFYCIWQGILWQDWFTDLCGSTTSPTIKKQASEAIDCARNGQPLLLAHTDAHASAITETCEIMGTLGIEVEQQS